MKFRDQNRTFEKYIDQKQNKSRSAKTKIMSKPFSYIRTHKVAL